MLDNRYALSLLAFTAMIAVHAASVLRNLSDVCMSGNPLYVLTEIKSSDSTTLVHDDVSNLYAKGSTFDSHLSYHADLKLRLNVFFAGFGLSISACRHVIDRVEIFDFLSWNNKHSVGDLKIFVDVKANAFNLRTSIHQDLLNSLVNFNFLNGRLLLLLFFAL